MKIIELTLDESQIESGVTAMSIVDDPAIESNFIAMSKDHKVEFKAVDGEKRILLGPAMIPNKTIYRKEKDLEYYCYFSEATVRKASELFFKNSNQNKATLQHAMKVEGLTVVESWIVEDSEKDKSAHYGLQMPKGTWMISVKVDNDDVWENHVKTGEVRGFSIEGYFTDTLDMSAHDPEELAAKAQVEELIKLLS